MPIHHNTQPSENTLKTGNRCGHDPLNPRWFEPPPEHGERPRIIVNWIERVRQFYEDPLRIPSLANALLGRKLAADPEGSHRPRQMRSERREACCSVLAAIAHYCDLPSLCLSVPQANGSLLPIRMQVIAAAAGLTLRRAERAMRDIVDAGLLNIFRRCERMDDGCYIGHAAIRVVPPSFFELFGLGARLEHDRRRISQQRIEMRGGPAPNAAARLTFSLGEAVGKILGRDSQRPEPARPIIVTPAPPPTPPCPIEFASTAADGSRNETVPQRHLRLMRESLGHRERQLGAARADQSRPHSDAPDSS